MYAPACVIIDSHVTVSLDPQVHYTRVREDATLLDAVDVYSKQMIGELWSR